MALQVKNVKFVDKAECVLHVGAWRIIIDKPSDGEVMVRNECATPESDNYGTMKYECFDHKCNSFVF